MCLDKIKEIDLIKLKADKMPIFMANNLHTLLIYSHTN